MAEYDDLLADLPAPNPEEPASLRDDIADELKDHLQCAARREAVSHPDPEDVENRVLARFGNPQKIARRLWLDWMKEILMTQKITLALVAIVAAASLGACGLMWSFARDFQAASAELLTQGRDANRELLKQNRQMMEKLTTLANQKPADMEWNPLKVRVVKNDEEHSPAEGFQVTLYTELSKQGIEAITNDEGIADFGMVRPGDHACRVKSPWGEELRLNIYVKPGSSHTEEIICPDGPPETHPVKPVVQWPAELEGKEIAVLVRIKRVDTTEVEEHQWQPVDSEQNLVNLLIRYDGRFATYASTSYQQSRVFSRNREQILQHGQVQFHSNPEIFDAKFPWKGEQVQILELQVVKLQREADFPAGGESLLCLSESELLRNELPGHFDPSPRGSRSRSRSYEKPISQNSKEGVEEWNIEISERDIWLTRAMLVIEQFSDARPEFLIDSVRMYFNFYDQDRNLEISENEAGRRKERLEGYGPFPISFETFIEKTVKLRQESES